MDYCEGCFSKKFADVLEVHRNQFILLRTLPKWEYSIIKSVLQQHSIAFGPNQFGSWGFDAKGGERQQILDSLANYGIPVHTIEEHVETLSARYSVERQELGNYCFLQLFIEGDWLALNPMTREWDLLEQQRSAALVREGSILCNENIGQVRYFWFKGFTTNREPKLIPLQERRLEYSLQIF
jgi:hypothetical protein